MLNQAQHIVSQLVPGYNRYVLIAKEGVDGYTSLLGELGSVEASIYFDEDSTVSELVELVADNLKALNAAYANDSKIVGFAVEVEHEHPDCGLISFSAINEDKFGDA